MALQTANIETEISKIQALINMGEGKITKAIKSLDKLKKNQLMLTDKQKQLHAAKVNISKFNKV